MRKLLLLAALAVNLVGCSKNEEEPYPSVVTELAMMSSDASSLVHSFYTDGAVSYRLSEPINTRVKNGTWRMLVGYVDEGGGRATVYTLTNVVVLRDSTELAPPSYDPTAFVSAWLGGGFLNLHLMPKTQGGKHYWAYARRGQHTNAAGGTTLSLTLHHRQGSDPQAYSTDAYLSIPLDSLAVRPEPYDSVELTIRTFNGTKEKSFALSR